MPRLKPLLPEERMKREFYGLIAHHAREIGLERDDQIAKLLGIDPSTYCKRKKAPVTSWRMSDLLIVFAKLNFSGEDIAKVFKKGMHV